MGYQYTMLEHLINLIIKFEFERIVRKHKGDKWVKKFNTKSGTCQESCVWRKNIQRKTSKTGTCIKPLSPPFLFKGIII